MTPRIVSPRDLQRSYREIFDMAIATGEPIIVTNRKRPEVAIVPIEMVESLYTQKQLRQTPPISQSGLVGIWLDRKDMKDTSAWVRKLRTKRLASVYAETKLSS